MNTRLNSLLPRPKHVNEGVGELHITGNAPAFLCTFSEGKPYELLKHLFSGIFYINSHAKAVLTISRNDRFKKSGGYRIEVADDIHLTVSGYEGFVASLVTLRDLAEFTPDGVSFPRCIIEDEPYKAQRGVHFYLPPSDLIGEFLDLLDQLAALKYNMIILETGGGVKLDRHPEVNAAWIRFCREAREYPGGPQGLQASESYWKDSTHVELACYSGTITKDELRQIVDRCDMLGIELIPEIQALSHAYYLTLSHPEIAERPYERWPDSYCPSNELSYKLYFEVAEEILEVIKPKRVSIGHDEIRVLGECPLCRGKSGHELLAYDLNKLHAFYAERGIQIMMWGEMLMKFTSFKGQPTGGVGSPERIDRYGRKYSMPATYLAALDVPKDIMLLDWYYSMAHHTERVNAANDFREIYGNFRGSLIANWDKRSVSDNLLGAEVSTWCVPNEYEMAFNGWFYELVFSAAVLWQSDFCDAKRDEFDVMTENYLPKLQSRLTGQRHFDGTMETLKAFNTAVGTSEAKVKYRRGTLDETTALRVASADLAPLKVGEKIDICGKAEKLVFFHATTDELKRRLTTWNFRDKGERIPARYIIDYDDGMTVTLPVEFGAPGDYGVAIGSKLSAAGYSRPDASGKLTSDIDDDASVNAKLASLSPLYEQNDGWRGALLYSCRYAEYDTPDGIRTVYASEWTNPCPERTIVRVRFFNEPASTFEAELYAVGLAK